MNDQEKQLINDAIEFLKFESLSSVRMMDVMSKDSKESVFKRITILSFLLKIAYEYKCEEQ